MYNDTYMSIYIEREMYHTCHIRSVSMSIGESPCRYFATRDRLSDV